MTAIPPLTTLIAAQLLGKEIPNSRTAESLPGKKRKFFSVFTTDVERIIGVKLTGDRYVTADSSRELFNAWAPVVRGFHTGSNFTGYFPHPEENVTIEFYEDALLDIGSGQKTLEMLRQGRGRKR
jgi:hypothetical protein